MAATGVLENKNNFDEIDEKIKELITETIKNGKTSFYDDYYLGYFKFKEDQIYIIYISGCQNINEIDKKLTEIFSGNIAAKFSYTLAIDYGLSESEVMLLKMASPMDDVGKIGIPDSILLKEGLLPEDEFKIMRTHSTIGYKILKNSKRDVLKAAALVALNTMKNMIVVVIQNIK